MFDNSNFLWFSCLNNKKNNSWYRISFEENEWNNYLLPKLKNFTFPIIYQFILAYLFENENENQVHFTEEFYENCIIPEMDSMKRQVNIVRKK